MFVAVKIVFYIILKIADLITQIKLVATVPSMQRLVFGADFKGNVGEGKGDKEVLCRYDVKKKKTEGKTVVHFIKRNGKGCSLLDDCGHREEEVSEGRDKN